MTFDWPWMLPALLVVPAAVVAYRRLLASRARRRERLAGVALVGPAPARLGRRRHVAPVLFLGALTLLVLALARPEATVAEPKREGTVVLAFDSSSSMRATDVAPDRLSAAKAAARQFVQRQPGSIRIGIVSFSEAGVITQRPTTDRTAVLGAIDRLGAQGGTSLGRAIQTSLSAIAGRTVQLDPESNTVEAQGQDLGWFRSSAVVLLSDGENTSGPDPVAVAQLASTAGVKVFTIGLGSPQGSVVQVDGYQLSTRLDEPTLQQIATTTDATYFSATDAQSLQQVYASVDLSWTLETKQTEISGLLAAAALLLLVLGAGLSVAWFGRVI